MTDRSQTTMTDTTTRRISNGPQIMCRMCGAISNHATGLCYHHRSVADGGYTGLTCADWAYLEWKRQRDGSDGR